MMTPKSTSPTMPVPAIAPTNITTDSPITSPLDGSVGEGGAGDDSANASVVNAMPSTTTTATTVGATSAITSLTPDLADMVKAGYITKEEALAMMTPKSTSQTKAPRIQSTPVEASSANITAVDSDTSATIVTKNNCSGAVIANVDAAGTVISSNADNTTDDVTLRAVALPKTTPSSITSDGSGTKSGVATTGVSIETANAPDKSGDGGISKVDIAIDAHTRKDSDSGCANLTTDTSSSGVLGPDSAACNDSASITVSIDQMTIAAPMTSIATTATDPTIATTDDFPPTNTAIATATTMTATTATDITTTTAACTATMNSAPPEACANTTASATTDTNCNIDTADATATAAATINCENLPSGTDIATVSNVASATIGVGDIPNSTRKGFQHAFSAANTEDTADTEMGEKVKIGPSVAIRRTEFFVVITECNMLSREAGVVLEATFPQLHVDFKRLRIRVNHRQVSDIRPQYEIPLRSCIDACHVTILIHTIDCQAQILSVFKRDTLRKGQVREHARYYCLRALH